MVGITAESVNFGMEHSRSIYNRLLTKVIFNPPDSIEEQEMEACMNMLPRLAFVNLRMTNHDVIQKTREPTWDLIEITAIIGAHKLLQSWMKQE